MRLDISGTEHWPKDNYYGLGKETEGPSECVRRVGWSLMGVLWVSESRPGVAAPPAAGARVCTLLVRGCGLTGRSAPCAV